MHLIDGHPFAGIGLHDEGTRGARGGDAGTVVEDALVAGIGGVPHRIARALGLGIDPVVDRDVAVAVDGETVGAMFMSGAC